MSRVIVDSDTGEIKSIVEDDEILSSWKSIDIIENRLNKSKFIKIYYSTIEILNNIKFSKQHYKLFFNLISLINYSSNIIEIRGIPANKKSISEYLGIKIDSLSRQLKKLEKYEIIKYSKHGRNKYIYLNPFVSSYGGEKDINVLQIFLKTNFAINTTYKRKSSNKVSRKNH